jgi:hypothetical protein
VVLRRDQPGIDVEAALLDREVVKAAPKLDAAHLHDPKAPPLSAIADGELFEEHYAVRDRVELEVILLDERSSSKTTVQFRLVKKCLSARTCRRVAKRALRKQAQLGQAVEDDPGRVELLDMLEDELCGLAQLHLGRVEHREFLLGVEGRLGRTSSNTSSPSSDQPWRLATRRSSRWVSDKVM